MKDRYFSAEMFSVARPSSLASGGAHIGIVFGTRDVAAAFAEDFREDPMRYKPVGWSSKVELQVGPLRMTDVKSKRAISCRLCTFSSGAEVVADRSARAIRSLARRVLS